MSHREAYSRLEAASEDALDGAHDATSRAAQQRLIELSRTLDAELRRMTERGLSRISTITATTAPADIVVSLTAVIWNVLYRGRT